MIEDNPKKLGDGEAIGNLQKDPDDWVTGDEPMTMAQASYLKSFSNATVDIEGNADERGTPEYNVALSERRANSVREYLSGQGIAASRMKIGPRGETAPIASGANEQAWAQNRNAYTKQTN